MSENTSENTATHTEVDKLKELESEVDNPSQVENEANPISEEEVLKFNEEAQVKFKELYTTHSRQELKEKCDQLFEMSEEEYQKVPLTERMALISWKVSFEKLDQIEKGLKFIREAYKTQQPGSIVSKEDSELIQKTIVNTWTYLQESENTSYRILVTRTDPIKPTSGIPIGILQKARNHPLRPDDPTLTIPAFIDGIDEEYAKNVTYVDKDVSGEFTGYILQEIKYFEKTADEVGVGLSPKQWAELKGDFYSFTIHPIDTCQEEFRNIGYSLCPKGDEEKTYQTVVFRTWLLDVTEDQGLVSCFG